MKNIILDKDNLDFLSIDPAKTIFWAGAGIGVLSPCNLPLGNDLTDAVLETVVGKENTNTLIRLWNDKFPEIQNSIQDNNWMLPAKKNQQSTPKGKDALSMRPRLEFIIGEVHKMDLEFQDISFQKRKNQITYQRTSIIKTLKNFTSAIPNAYHYALADFIRAGSILVTTNFDVCIEKALGLKEDEIKATSIDGIPAMEYKGGRYIYHAHGIATDKNIDENLGATLTNVSKSISRQFTKKLCKCFADGYTIIFIGYGGVDFFDIKPFFDSLGTGVFPGKAIYLHYCSEKVCKNEINRVKNYQYLLTPFQEQYICYGDTKIFLSKLTHQSNINITKTKSPAIHNNNTAFSTTKEALSSIATAYTPAALGKYQFINMFRIASQLNVSIKYFYPDWADRLAIIYNEWKTDAPEQETLKKMILGPVDIARCIVDDIRNNNWYSKNTTYAKIRQDILQIFKMRQGANIRTNLKLSDDELECDLQKYVTQTYKILETNADDDISIQIETAVIQYLCGPHTKRLYLKWILDIPHRHETQKQLHVLLDYMNQLLEHTYNHFHYMTFYIALNRRRHILNTILNEKPIINAEGTGSGIPGDLYLPEMKCYGDIQAEWDICMEIPNLFDAEKVIQGVLEQYVFRACKGKGLPLRKIFRLCRIKKKISKIRKG